MPYQPHEVFTPPPDDATIWRYLDFAKFLSLLESGCLYFARADRLGDPFEGSTTRVTVEARKDWMPKQGLPETFAAEFEQIQRQGTQTHFVNCWHLSDHESEAMWRLYLKSNEGIAIRSTFARLRQALENAEPDVFIGVVSYVDYDKQLIPEGNAFWPFLHKRLSLEHDRELRAIITGFVDLVYNRATVLENPDVRLGTFEEGRKLGVDLEQTSFDLPVGLKVPVDLGTLIETIYVAPTADAWLGDLAKSVCRRYDLSMDVNLSRLGEDPIY